MPILGERLFNELDQERYICITGSLSGGKSRLAFDIALHYWRQGFRVLANVPHNFIDTDLTRPDEGMLYRSYCVIDEGGEYIRTAKLSSLITRSAGKADYYVVFAGKRLPHKELQGIIIKPRFDFYQNYGIPVILWRALVNATEKYKFPFWQVFPSAIHGTYSTRTSSGGVENFISRAALTVQHLAAMEGQEAGQQAEAGFAGLADDLSSSFGEQIT